MVVRVLDAERLARAKRAYTTCRAAPERMKTLIGGAIRPDSGDLVLARVDEVRKQKRIELTDGRKALLFPGDEVIVCYGNRYAPDQYEAVIGIDLSPCELVAAGGVAARELSRNLRMLEPTRITPIGLIGDANGNRLNVRAFALPDHDRAPSIPIVLSLGTSMNAGKTLTATSLVRGLKKAGYRVAALKATGTGSGNDMWIVRDAGADVVLDFTDAGYSGTYLIPQDEIEAATRRLIAHAALQGCDIAIVEVADGLQHLETAALIEAKHVWTGAVGVVFAAYDAMGAKCGVDLLRLSGHRVLAISGRIALSPLAMREAERATGLRVYTPAELQEGALVDVIAGRMGSADRRNGAAAPLERPASAAGAPGVPQGVTIFRPGDRSSAPRPENPSAAVVTFPAELRPERPAARLPRAVLPVLLTRIARRVMELDVDALCGAAPGAREKGRINRRNGYRRRRWTTWLGDIELMVPRLRKGGYNPPFLAERALRGPEFAAVADRCLEPEQPASALAPLITLMGAAVPPEAELARLKEELQSAIQEIVPDLADRRQGAIRLLALERDRGGLAAERLVDRGH